MVEQRQISITIPTFNRFELLFKSFEKVIDDDRIDEVVIVDDCSENSVYEKVKWRAKSNPKIKVFRNEYNRDCYWNKYTSISHATNDWCILLDSDNEIDTDYIDRIFGGEHWDENTAYLPAFAAPHFDYRKFQGLTITKENVSNYMHDTVFSCMLNTHNHFVNKNFYMKCWDAATNPHTSDSIYMNYLWLKNGGKLYVVPGLTYQHRVDNHEGEEGGHYNANNHKTGNFHQQVEQMLKELR